MDISFESSCEKGFEKTSEAGNNFFGGILIRSLVKDVNIAITGPLKCCWELFDCLSPRNPESSSSTTSAISKGNRIQLNIDLMHLHTQLKQIGKLDNA